LLFVFSLIAVIQCVCDVMYCN